MRRTRLAAAIALVALAATALLMRCSEGPAPDTVARDPEFPRAMTPAEWKRVESRRTAPAGSAPAGVTAATDGAAPQPKRDPFLVALPPVGDQPLVVLEANALRHSRLGELFVRCLLRDGGEARLDEFRRESGIDPLKDIDRIAFSSAGVLVSGFFDRARFDRLEPRAAVEAYGERGRLYRFDAGEGAEQSSLGTWGDGLVAFGTAQFVADALDRVEGRASPAPPALPEELTYGEAYGVIPGAALGPLLRGQQAEIAQRLAALAQRVELHADAMNDVALVARISGSDAAGLDDLAKTIGTALAVARLEAKATGSTGLADVLELARVERGSSGRFSLELAVPADVLERWFAGCGETAPQR